MRTAPTRALIDTGLAEDVGGGDVTTDSIVPAELMAEAGVVVRAPGVICGLDAAMDVFRTLDPTAATQLLAADGELIDDAPRTVAIVRGHARAILTGERLALNLLQRASGIASATRRYADAVAGFDVELLDTRKTVPGLRELDRHAVRCGGGTNHRFGLFDAVLIKDNHIAIAGGIEPAVAAVLKNRPGASIEIEVDTLDQLDQALACGADTILLDNMPPAILRDAVRQTDGRARLEASGGITLETIAEVAATGVDAISIGALTHSVSALDIALEVRT
jgi:nicotinate-nucleotide pyrophosphorylase (carboxylating)